MTTAVSSSTVYKRGCWWSNYKEGTPLRRVEERGRGGLITHVMIPLFVCFCCFFLVLQLIYVLSLILSVGSLIKVWSENLELPVCPDATVSTDWTASPARPARSALPVRPDPKVSRFSIVLPCFLPFPSLAVVFFCDFDGRPMGRWGEGQYQSINFSF